MGLLAQLLISSVTLLVGLAFGIWRTYRTFQDDWRQSWRKGFWRGREDLERHLWQDATELREQMAGRPSPWVDGFEYAASRVSCLNDERKEEVNDDPQSLGPEEAT